VVVSFDIDRKEAIEILYKEIGAMYQDYELLIIPDTDVTD
jgi:ABC-type ATPase involved in cell division